MFGISSEPVHMFLDFNAVIVNLDSLSVEEQRVCLSRIGENVKTLKAYLEENIEKKEGLPEIPDTGKAVLRQQYILIQAIETWMESMWGKIAED